MHLFLEKPRSGRKMKQIFLDLFWSELPRDQLNCIADIILISEDPVAAVALHYPLIGWASAGPISEKEAPFRSSTLDALTLASDDGHHLRKLFDLGRDLAPTLETKLRITDMGARGLVAELDGFELQRCSSCQDAGLIIHLVRDGLAPSRPRLCFVDLKPGPCHLQQACAAQRRDGIVGTGHQGQTEIRLHLPERLERF